MMTPDNPLGLRGLAFLEFTSPEPDALDRLFTSLGFSRTRRSVRSASDLYAQGGIRFLLTEGAPGSHAEGFRAAHGPSVPSIGLRMSDPEAALAEALRRGATEAPAEGRTLDAPAIVGIGGALLYFLPADPTAVDPLEEGFGAHPKPRLVPELGFHTIDHLTHNVPKGGLETWSRFYKDLFGFTDVRTFDIRGEKTGLTSYALRSPDGSFCIPINEGSEEKSQIEEYLRAYRGPGVQHIALLSDDLLGSLDQLAGQVPTLDIDSDYYATVFDRVPGVREAPERIEAHQVLVDGDEEGYLLQIFTQNLIGPVFFELIQRRNHLSFGEGNFGALFRSLERDQERRGVL